MRQNLPANAVFMITPGGQVVGQGQMNQGVYVPAPAPQMQMQYRPRQAMGMSGSGVSGLPELVELGQAVATLVWARPATVTPPPDSADVNANQRNQVLYTASVANTTLMAKRNEVLISESARALRAVVSYAEKRRSAGLPLMAGW